MSFDTLDELFLFFAGLFLILGLLLVAGVFLFEQGRLAIWRITCWWKGHEYQTAWKRHFCPRCQKNFWLGD